MKKYAILLGTVLLTATQGIAQEFPISYNDGRLKEKIQFSPLPPKEQANNEDIYKLNWKTDIPVTAAGTIWSAFAFTQIYSKDPIPDEVVAGLKKEDINSFDRWAAGMNDDEMDGISNYLFYGSIPLPALLFFDNKIRKDAPKIGLMYWETFAVTGLLYIGSTYFTNRYRPETYDNSIPVSERTGGGYKNSFFAGHVAVTATATFFMAKVYNDYHPESGFRYVLWGGAVAATGAMVYMRHAAGKHFPTDLIIGTAVGTLSGILIPHFHKVRNGRDQAWRIGPSVNPYNGGGAGLSFTCKIP